MRPTAHAGFTRVGNPSKLEALPAAREAQFVAR